MHVHVQVDRAAAPLLEKDAAASTLCPPALKWANTASAKRCEKARMTSARNAARRLNFTETSRPTGATASGSTDHEIGRYAAHPSARTRGQIRASNRKTGRGGDARTLQKTRAALPVLPQRRQSSNSLSRSGAAASGRTRPADGSRQTVADHARAACPAAGGRAGRMTGARPACTRMEERVPGRTSECESFDFVRAPAGDRRRPPDGRRPARAEESGRIFVHPFGRRRWRRCVTLGAGAL